VGGQIIETQNVLENLVPGIREFLVVLRVDEVDEFDDAGEEEDDRYEREEIDEVEDPFAADEL